MKDAAYEAMKKAKNQRDSKNVQGALDTLEDYLLTDIYNTEVRMLAAQIAFDNGMKDYGMLQLDVIIDIDPENIDARKALVTILKKNKKDTKEAHELFEYLVQHCPEDDSLWNSYGVFCRMQLTDFKKAAECYEKAISIRPDVADYHLNYSIVLVNDIKDYVKGRAELEEGIRLDPTNQRAKDAHARLMKKKFRNEVPKKSLFSFRKK